MDELYREVKGLPSLIEADKEAVRRYGLPEYIKLAWPILEPKRPLIWGWYLDAICEHVMAVLTGKIRQLLITIPPGTSKSIITSVFTPSYDWIENPSRRSQFVSYSGTLSIRDSIKCRSLIESQWYQERWGDRYKLSKEQNTKTKYENDKTGYRIATSVGGTITGDRTDFQVCDDLLSVQQAESPAALEAASRIFWETLPSRAIDLDNVKRIVIMQRLHNKDVAGEILTREPDQWDHLNLPMEAESKTRCFTSLGFVDKRPEGESLHPERFKYEEIEKLKRQLGSYAYAGQYQQRPAPREGGIIKEAWLKTRFRSALDPTTCKARNPLFIAQSYDCASKAKDRNDPTVGLTLGVFKDHYELYDVYKKKVEFPEGQRQIKSSAGIWGPAALLIEDKDSGQQHIQQLKADTRLPIIGMNPGTEGKAVRMITETPQLEALKLWLPEEAPWLADLVTVLTLFTGKDSDEDNEVDALSQFLRWVRTKMGYMTPVAPVGDDSKSAHSIDGY